MQVIDLIYAALLFYVLWLIVYLLLHLGASADVTSLNSLRLWLGFGSFLSLSEALAAAKGLGWWGGWETAGAHSDPAALVASRGASPPIVPAP